MKKIRVGDNVMVIAGKFKGTTATVEAIGHDKVVLKGVNKVKRAVKGKGFVEKDAPLHISNVMPYDEKEGKASRIRVTEQKGKKVRTYVKTKNSVK